MRSCLRPGIAIMAAMFGLAGCGDDANQPYVAFEGGGFVFNYRTARAFYEFNIRPMRAMEPGTVLEAEFENPAGPPPLLVREPVRADRLRYLFRSPGLNKIKKDTPYRAVIRVKKADGTELASYEKSFVSSADQAELPAEPLVLGPGYARNPESDLALPR